MPSKYQKQLEFEAEQRDDLVGTAVARWVLEVHERIDKLVAWAHEINDAIVSASSRPGAFHGIKPPESEDDA